MVRLKGRPGAPENSVEFQFHNGTIKELLLQR